MKKFAALLVTIYLAAHLSACTSKESREDESAPATEETAAVDSELEKVEGADAQASAGGDEANAGFVDEQLPEQALGESQAPAADTAVAEAPPAEQPAVDAPPADTAVADAPPATDTALADNSAPPAMDAPPPEEAPAPAPDTSVAAGTTEAPPAVDPGTEKHDIASSDTPKVSPPLRKMDSTPRHEGGQLLNAVYVARSGDNFKKISKMIYGDASHVKDLKNANPSLGGSVKTGDKVYYNSPQRPTDETVVKTFYEDQGMQPEVYVAKEGDNLKKVAKNLLGSTTNWKELWVTNKDLDSKGPLTAGTEIHYWKGGATGTAVAANEAPKNEMAGGNQMPPPPEQMPPAPEMPQQMPPPPADNMAANQMPPPADSLPPAPEMNAGAAGAGMAMNDAPPPPPPAEMAPPPPPAEMAPPPPPPPVAKPHGQMAEEGMSNDDMMMGLAAVGILAAGVAAIMVIRKRRQQKEMANAFGDTQVGAS